MASRWQDDDAERLERPPRICARCDVHPEDRPPANGRQFTRWETFRRWLGEANPDPAQGVPKYRGYRRDTLRILPRIEVSTPELPELLISHSIQLDTMQGVDQGTGEGSVLGHDPDDPVQATLRIEVPSLERKLVCRPCPVIRGPGEPLAPPPPTLHTDRYDLARAGSLNLDGPFGATNRSDGLLHIASWPNWHHVPGLPDPALIAQVLLRRRRPQDQSTATRGQSHAAYPPDSSGLSKGAFTLQGSFEREPAQSLGSPVPDENGVARKNGECGGGSELPGSIPISAYSMKELSGGIEYTNLGGNLLDYRKASVGQPGCRDRSRPLVFRCALDDSNPNARSIGESDGRRTLEDAGREFVDYDSGRIRNRGLEWRVIALATSPQKTKGEQQQVERRPRRGMGEKGQLSRRAPGRVAECRSTHVGFSTAARSTGSFVPLGLP